MIWIGRPGSLVRIDDRAVWVRSVKADRVVSAKTTVEGTRRVYLGRGGPRSWTLNTNSAAGDVRLLLDAFVSGSVPAPVKFLDDMMQSTNALLPGESTCSTGWINHSGAGVTLAHGVPMTATDGRELIGATAVGANAQTGYWRCNIQPDAAPVVPGQAYTFSAYASATQQPGAMLRILFLDRLGVSTTTTNFYSSRGPTTGEVTRLSVTAVAPPNSVMARGYVFNAARIAAPCLTWTSDLRDPAPGAGVQSVIVTEGGDLEYDGRYERADAVYTVMEVGRT